MNQLIRDLMEAQDEVTHYNITGQWNLIIEAKEKRAKAIENLEKALDWKNVPEVMNPDEIPLFYKNACEDV